VVVVVVLVDEGIVVVEVEEPVVALVLGAVVEVDVEIFDLTGVVVVGLSVVVGGLEGVFFCDEFDESGEVQSVGGEPDPVWPGINTVPAQPKFENVASRVTEPPSLKASVDLTSRM
jgi:hypothetical protein